MTAELFLKSKDVIWETDHGTNVVNDFDCCKIMIEFAKLKVTEALKAASEKADSFVNMDDDTYIEGNVWSEIDKQSILTAYPLDLIK